MPYDASFELRSFNVEDKAKLLHYLYTAKVKISESTLRYCLGGCYLPQDGEAVDVSEKAFNLLKKKKPKWIKGDMVIPSGGLSVDGLIVEHSVPIKVLHDHIEGLLAKGKFDIKILKKLLCKYCKVALITSAENKRLNKRYKSSMPEKWSFKSGMVHARYAECEIKMHKQK